PRRHTLQHGTPDAVTAGWRWCMLQIGRPPSRRLDDPVRKLRPEHEAAELWLYADEIGPRHTARTLARLPGLRMVVIVLPEGDRIPEHRADADIAIQVLKGAVRIHAGGTLVD